MAAQDVNQVSSAKQDDRVPIVTDLSVDLGVVVRRSDKDAKGPMADARDEACDLADTDGIGGGIAFRFKSEVDQDPVGSWSEEVDARGVTSAVPAGPGDIDGSRGRGHHAPQLDGARLKAMRIVSEVTMELVDDRPTGGVSWGLLLPAPDDCGGGSGQRSVTAPVYPLPPDLRTRPSEGVARARLVDPLPRKYGHVQDGEPRSIRPLII